MTSPSTTRAQLLRTLRAELPRLRREYGVAALRLFGSMARGDETARSDIDLLVDFVQVPSLFKLGRLKEDLERRLGRPVDVVTPGGLRPRVLQRANREAVAV